MSDTDLELLASYTRHRAEDAFAEIVRRHLDLVFTAALRQVRSPQLAEEVAQSTFISLAHDAGRLAPDTILAAWLYQVAHRTAINLVRREARRQLREQIATEMTAMNATTADWTHIEPLLDEAMHALDDTDRAAVLLRYFENKSLREVGEALGASENAAQKRLSRAIESLREFFAKRGVTVGASGLVVVISANAVQAAPIGLAVTISTAAALAGSAFASTATATATKAVAMTTMQKTLITSTLALAVGVGIYESRQASGLSEELQTLRQKHVVLSEEIVLLQRERDEASRQLASFRETNERLSLGSAELLKLRGQIGVLRQELAEAKQRLDHAAKTINSSDRTWGIGETRWRTNWMDSGLTSPQAALLTYWWAVANLNIDRVKSSMVFSTGGPVSESYAKREAQTEGAQTYSDTFGGLRLSSVKLSNDRAMIEVDVLTRITAKGGIPVAADDPPEWSAGRNRTFDLMRLGDEWKVVGEQNLQKLRLSDPEDAEAVASMLFNMSPDVVEKLKPRIPPATLRAYEELRIKAEK
jgi:RNA polymerase sigma factor (sigma-70 family)